MMQSAPWQQRTEEQLERDRPSAVLLTGISGIGKQAVALRLCRRHLCLMGRQTDCDCTSCRLFKEEAHPDFLLSESTTSTIGVAQAREAKDFAERTASISQGRAVLIDADRITRAAANALLKLLEEPPQGLLLALHSSRPGLLPPTLRSRMRHYRVPAPNRDESLQWYEQQRPEEPERQDELFELLLHLRGGPMAAMEQMQAGEGERTLSALQDLQELLAGRQDAVTVANRWAGKTASGHPAAALHLCCQMLLAAAAFRAEEASSESVEQLQARPLSHLSATGMPVSGPFIECVRLLAERGSLKQLVELARDCQSTLDAVERQPGRNRVWLAIDLLLALESLAGVRRS